jgi:hypothetical protein
MGQNPFAEEGHEDEEDEGEEHAPPLPHSRLRLDNQTRAFLNTCWGFGIHDFHPMVARMAMVTTRFMLFVAIHMYSLQAWEGDG